LFKHCTAALAAFLALASPCGAQTPPPGTLSFTNDDLVTLVRAVHAADTAPASEISVTVSTHSAGEMPSYDPIAHYNGLDAGQAHSASVWVVGNPPASEIGDALLGAIELACMDTGFAGTKWKAIYDQVAVVDAALPASVADRYENRHLLLQRIAQALHSTHP